RRAGRSSGSASRATPFARPRRAGTRPRRRRARCVAGIPWLPLVGAQRRNVEALGEPVESVHDLRGDGDALLLLARARLVASLAGHEDALDAGQALRGTQVADELVDRGLELRDLAERGRIDRDDRLYGVGRGLRILVEVD